MAWTWTGIADRALAALLYGPMKALEQDLALAAKYYPVQARVATTNATVTTLYTATILVNTTVLTSGLVVARRTGGSAGATNDGAGYVVEFVARNTTGTAALIGAGAVTVLGESQAGWDVTLSASGGTILVRVTGATNNNISWRWTGRMFSVQSED